MLGTKRKVILLEFRVDPVSSNGIGIGISKSLCNIPYHPVPTKRVKSEHLNEGESRETGGEEKLQMSSSSHLSQTTQQVMNEGQIPPPAPAKREGKSVTFMEGESSGKMKPDSPKKYVEVSKARMKEFREAFGFFDKDGDGSITKDELGIVMRSLGQFASEQELKEMLEEVDINGDGTFSFDEFVQIVANYSGNVSVSDEEQELRDAFRIFDKHNRGYISASDLRAVLHCLGEDLSEDEIEMMIKEVDVDGDGRIDFDEFVKALGEPEEMAEDDEVESPNPI